MPLTPRRSTFEVVAEILRERALGRGVTVAELRALYPAKDVRRTALVEALRFLESTGALAWNGERARWVGPLPGDARPLGVSWRRLARDLDRPAAERVEAAARLSEALLAGRSGT